MEKAITIVPSNKEMSVKLSGLKLVNEFQKMGFSHGAFLTIVGFHFPKYKDSKERAKLSNWWYSKIPNREILKEIEIVLNKLRNE